MNSIVFTSFLFFSLLFLGYSQAEIPLFQCYTGTSTLVTESLGTLNVATQFYRIGNDRVVISVLEPTTQAQFCLRTFVGETALTNTSYGLVLQDVCAGSLNSGLLGNALPACAFNGSYVANLVNETLSFDQMLSKDPNCNTRFNLLKGATLSLSDCAPICNCSDPTFSTETVPPTTLAPNATTAAPNGTTNFTSTPSSNITSPPDNTTTTPGNFTSPPDNTTTTPGNFTSPPDNTTTTPSNFTSPPDNTTTNFTTTPSNFTSPPDNTTGNFTTPPSNFTSPPDNTTGNFTTPPSNFTSPPDNTTGNFTTPPSNYTSPPNTTLPPNPYDFHPPTLVINNCTNCSPVNLTSFTCVHNRGGWTTLTGTGFDQLSVEVPLTIFIGGQLCLSPTILSSTSVSCLVAAGFGTQNQIVINSFLLSTNFSYCAPVVTSISHLPSNATGNFTSGNSSSSSSTLLITGQNFGTEASAIRVAVARATDKTAFRCENVSLVGADSLICQVPSLPSGQFFVQVNVDGQSSNLPGANLLGATVSGASNVPVGSAVTLTVGECYSRTNINATMVDMVLTQLSVQKTLGKLKSLVSDLLILKERLPSFEGSECCGTETLYPIPSFELQYLSSDSFEFKDCVDSFCSQREQFLVNL